MPKEVIRDETGPYDVEVGWHRDGFVQLATVMRDIGTNPGQRPMGSPADIRELVMAAKEPEAFVGSRGLYSTLDRSGMNRLIRALRRARDQAFGRDE